MTPTRKATDPAPSTAPAALSGYKEIARYVAARIGEAVSAGTVRKWGCRADDPLPVRRFGRLHARISIEVSDLDGWIERQWLRGARNR
jgi:hypothetical protein